LQQLQERLLEVRLRLLSLSGRIPRQRRSPTVDSKKIASAEKAI